MMLAGFFLLLLLTDVPSSEGNCSYQDVLNHLNLTKSNELFYMTRPVNNHETATKVNLDVLLYAILDMKEKEQTFVPYVWITKWWNNDYISWDPNDFCGITTVSIPAEIMWKPDLTIEEMFIQNAKVSPLIFFTPAEVKLKTERDKAPPTPYLIITHKGGVELTNDQVLLSTCRMHVYKFPFDIQTCNLTFKSVVHSVEEINLQHFSNSSEVTKESREVMRTQSEWLFISMDVTDKIINNFGFNQSTVIFTITMKRRSTLYIINFLLPVLFFLCLDLASFLISERGGEKLGFKVTVLLAITVMQLILNEILPSSSNRIPLIAVYCMGIFSLMMLSLMETIVVMYLIEKDSAAQDNEADGKLSLVNKVIQCGSDVSPGKSPSELLPEAKEGSSNQLMDDSLSSELTEVLKTLILLLKSKEEEEKPGYWTRKTKTINKAFFIFYVTSATMFLLCMFFSWNNARD